MSLHRLLGFHVEVPQPDDLVAFYGEVGLHGDATAGYAGVDGGATITLDEGDFRRLHSVRVGCHTAGDLDDIATRLGEEGAVVTRGDESVSVVEPVTQTRFVVEIAEPTALLTPAPVHPFNAPGRVVRASRRAPAVFETSRPPRRLGHLVLGSPQVEETTRFLVALGFRLSDSAPGILNFLRCSTDHHNVAVVDAPVPLLQHYSFECDDVDHLGHLATQLYRRDPDRHTWGLGRHFAGSNFYWYLKDPTGSFLELYSDLDQILDDDDWEQHGRTAFPLENVANAWGPNLPLEFVVPHDLDVLQRGWDART